jgi:hypothetical protein
VQESEPRFDVANIQLSLFDQLRLAEPDLADTDVVRRLCERLLDEAAVEPPIPVELIASLRGIRDILECDQPWAGMLAPENGSLVVRVRASDGWRRQRFTILHEAGHTLLPGFAEAAQFRCNGSKTRTEELSDLAASELLLPRRYFKPDLVEAGFSLDAVEALSEIYDASIEATALRTVDLCDEPALMLSFSRRHKPSERAREETCEPKLRLDWAHGSGPWPYARRHKSVEDDSVFARAEIGELITEHGDLGDLVAEDLPRLEIHARRYGSNGRVLALVRHAR